MHFVSLSEIYPEGSCVFPKYPEPVTDYHANSKYRFMAGDYGPEVIHTEAARILPVIGRNVQILLEQNSVPPELRSYMRDTYPEFHSDGIIPYRQGEHISVIESMVAERSLFVLHPYDAIPESAYAISPDLINRLNNKSFLHHLSSRIPERKIIRVSDLAGNDVFPFVLKWDYGASGDGVRIIRDRHDLDRALTFFSPEWAVLWEEYIDIRDNMNVQLAIRGDGAHVLGVSRQYTNEQGEYNGNLIVKEFREMPTEVEEIALEAGNAAFSEGFRGVCGLDIIESTDGSFYLIDPNFRLNGSTSTLLLSDNAFSETKAQFLRFGSFETNFNQLSDAIKVADSSTQSEGFRILSVYPNYRTNTLKWFGIFYGEDAADMVKIQEKLLSSGIKF